MDGIKNERKPRAPRKPRGPRKPREKKEKKPLGEMRTQWQHSFKENEGKYKEEKANALIYLLSCYTGRYPLIANEEKNKRNIRAKENRAKLSHLIFGVIYMAEDYPVNWLCIEEETEIEMTEVAITVKPPFETGFTVPYGCISIKAPKDEEPSAMSIWEVHCDTPMESIVLKIQAGEVWVAKRKMQSVVGLLKGQNGNATFNLKCSYEDNVITRYVLQAPKRYTEVIYEPSKDEISVHKYSRTFKGYHGFDIKRIEGKQVYVLPLDTCVFAFSRFGEISYTYKRKISQVEYYEVVCNATYKGSVPWGSLLQSKDV